MKIFRKALNPDCDPDTAYIKLDQVVLTAEKDLIEKYQAFSAELLRMSLAGITVIGFIYKEVLKDLPNVSRQSAGLSAIFFGISAVCAISHRYLSSETLRYYIWGLRWEGLSQGNKASIAYENAKLCLKARFRSMVACVALKALSALALALGASLIAFAFILPLLHKV
jgi:hypothetical protein